MIELICFLMWLESYPCLNVTPTLKIPPMIVSTDKQPVGTGILNETIYDCPPYTSILHVEMLLVIAQTAQPVLLQTSPASLYVLIAAAEHNS